MLWLTEDYVKPLGLGLEIPNFVKEREKFTIMETVKSRKSPNERVDVERMIQRVKFYHIFDSVVPIHMLGSMNQIMPVCALLSNFQEPILKKT